MHVLSVGTPKGGREMKEHVGGKAHWEGMPDGGLGAIGVIKLQGIDLLQELNSIRIFNATKAKISAAVMPVRCRQGR